METGQQDDQSLIRREDHVPHEWPVFDDNYCSCCRGQFLHGSTNVVRLQRAPERILDFNGKQIGVVKGSQYKAVLHAMCWKRHFGKRVDCEKCGGFSDNLKLQDGSMNKCWCTCHTGSNDCSFVLEPNQKNVKKALE